MKKKRKIKIKLYALLFSSIFFIKMLISAAPILYAHLCSRQQVAAVIMQLELEHNSGKSNCDDSLSEKLAKEFPVYLDRNIFVAPIYYLSVKTFIADEPTNIKSFYPSVPTPPPNC